MPFCQSCGHEIGPGKNFCSRCGAPLAAPAPSPPSSPQDLIVPPSPPLHPPAPAPPLNATGPPRDKLIIAGVMGAAILALIIFIGLPLIQSPGTNGNALLNTVPSSSDAPAVTIFAPVTTLSSGSVAAASGTTVYRAGIAYDQVYARDYTLDNGQMESFSFNLQQSPMIIECEMNPKIVTREQLVDIGKASERYIKSTYPDPNAWLDLQVIDADTGRETTTISFHKNYMGSTKQEYTVRATGNYRFELAGSRVSPTVRLLVKK